MKKNCLQCEKEFKTKINRGKVTKFCSLDCYHKNMVGKPTGRKTLGGGWNKGIKQPGQSGKNHFRWIADRSQIKVGDRSMNDPLQKGWRQAVKDRDGWKCRIADVNCDGRLEAHHILPWSKFPELRYQINNGITLCHHHHPRKTAEVMELSPFFQGLVAEMN